ncbi:MAG: hypothetical protein ABR906_07315 [Terracidiphilus sp.]
MKARLVLLFLCASLLASMQARATTILPDACGDDDINFDVKTLKDQPPPAPPPDGKAQIVFVEEQNQRAGTFTFATVRYGVDGAWVGANHGDSYFVLNIAPGVHHLCASGQRYGKEAVGLTTFTAESGKVYYFDANMMVTRSGGGFVSVSGALGTSTGMAPGSVNTAFRFTQLSDDDGQYRVKAWKLATWKFEQ